MSPQALFVAGLFFAVVLNVVECKIENQFEGNEMNETNTKMNETTSFLSTEQPISTVNVTDVDVEINSTTEWNVTSSCDCCHFCGSPQEIDKLTVELWMFYVAIGVVGFVFFLLSTVIAVLCVKLSSTKHKLKMSKASRNKPKSAREENQQLNEAFKPIERKNKEERVTLKPKLKKSGEEVFGKQGGFRGHKPRSFRERGSARENVGSWDLMPRKGTKIAKVSKEQEFKLIMAKEVKLAEAASRQVSKSPPKILPPIYNRKKATSEQPPSNKSSLQSSETNSSMEKISMGPHNPAKKEAEQNAANMKQPLLVYPFIS